jgi:hypothetical protein
MDQDGPRPTNAPSGLGALAASLQALECQKLLAGQWDDVAVGRQVTISALGHRHYVTRFARNAHCRSSHETWNIQRLGRSPGALTLARAFALGRTALGTDEPLRLRVANQIFACALHCVPCGAQRDLAPRLLARLGPGERACAQCGQPMRAAGFDASEWLPAADQPAPFLRASLRRLGMRRGDILTLAGEATAAHFEIGADR